MDNMDTMFSQGNFFTGCNYWASHAGTAMWSDWREDVVESDFKRLSDAGIKVIRVFPLWSDFQPIQLLKKYSGQPMEYRIGEELLSDDEEGRAGVSKIAIEHFEEFTRLAEKYGLRLIVGLITGWMSGRMFVPPALEGRNILIDPLAIKWEVRFVKYFVARFKNCSTIVAWDLGNECNCMAEVSSAEQAWYWSSSITNAIKTVDTSRQVISGMHGLSTEGNWMIQDQAETTDILTTHPYSYFTPHCDQDAINTIRTGLHAVAQTLYYRGIGNKPCFIEELGTLGPMFANDEVGAEYIRNNLFTQWSHDCLGFLWWCANEQSNLTQAPYDWASVERELGLFRKDGMPKPVLLEISKFTRFIENFPYKTLPSRIVDGVCILTDGQDTWGVAYSTFILAKQAGLDIEYQYSKQPIKDAKLYFLPSLKGDACISLHRMNELLEKVRNGAVLYISMDNGLLSPFSEYSGIRVITREKCSDTNAVTLNCVKDMRRKDGIGTTDSTDHKDSKIKLPLKGSYKFELEVLSAEVIGTDQGGKPAFTCAKYGKGKVFFLNYPVETYLLDKPGAFHKTGAMPYWAIYKHLQASINSGKVVCKDIANVGITEHIQDENTRIIILINYQPELLSTKLTITKTWKITNILYGDQILESNSDETCITINKNDAVVLVISKL